MRLTEHADVSSDATCKEALPQTGREGLLFFYFSFCSVARWGATFCSFRGIGEGGTASPRGSWSRGVGPCGPRYAGAPPRAPGDFRFTTKVTKGVPGALPLDPVGGHYHPPSSAPRCSPQKGEGATKGSWICHFEVVRAIGISFSRSSVEETPAAFKPWRGDDRRRMCQLCRVCVKFVSGNLALLSHLLDLDTVNTVFLSKDIL